MPEMANASSKARHAMFVTQIERVLIAFAAAGVDEAGDAGIDQDLRAIVEGEEGIGVGDCVFGEWAGFGNGELAACNAIHLACACAEEACGASLLCWAADADSVTGKAAADWLEKQCRGELMGSWVGAGAVLVFGEGCESYVARLNQDAAGDGTNLPSRLLLEGSCGSLQDSQVLPALAEDSKCSLFVVGGDEHFEEDFFGAHAFGRGDVDFV